MPPVLRTKKDQAQVTIAGVGRLPANGVGGVLLTDAAEALSELQDSDGKPLEGSALKKAAEAFAEARGYEVAQVSDAKVDKLPELAGATPDRPPLVEVAQDDPFAAFASTAEGDPPAPADPTDTPAEAGTAQP
jgi:hypothetical protein